LEDEAMPKLAQGTLPSYRVHKPSGRAVVTLPGTGRDIYLGPADSAESYRKYDRTIAQWLARGRTWPRAEAEERASVATVAGAFLAHAEGYYRLDTLYTLRRVVKELVAHSGPLPCEEFGPRALKSLRQTWIAQGLARRTINLYASWVRFVFKWAAGEELTTAAVHQALLAVPGIPKDRGIAHDRPKVRPVDVRALEATLLALKPIYRAMVKVQLLPGMRSMDMLGLRPSDLERGGDVWVYRPERYKGDFREDANEGDLFYAIGPRCQAELQPWLALQPKATGYVFRPRAAKGNLGGKYHRGSYYGAIQRACVRAGVERWHPHQLRHSTGTLVRKLYGIEAAQAVLGHARIETTEIYACRSLEQAKEIARAIG
jgi:integrase